MTAGPPPAPAQARAGLERPWLFCAGAVIGFFASWCGIGGGLFAIPLLHFAGGVELKRAVATGLALVVATAVAATAAELLQPAPSLRPALVGPLALGALAGAPLGFAALERISVGWLRRLLIVVLVVAGWRMLGTVHGAAPPSGALEPQQALLAGLVGLGGGFLAPLVGVGGGLLMVPALFLLLGVSFEEARASSLCAAVFAAGRSLFLHARAGRVLWSLGLPLAAGALAGAAAGVWVLARYGLVEEARTLFALLLFAVALRFALAPGGTRRP